MYLSTTQLKRCVCYFSRFYPRQSKLLNRCRICDISQHCMIVFVNQLILRCFIRRRPFMNLNLQKCNNCNTAQLLSCDFGDHHWCQHLQSGENSPDCGISNLKKPTCASKQDVLELTTLWYDNKNVIPGRTEPIALSPITY